MGLRLIAGAKLAKGVGLAFVALGIFDMIHKDLAAEAIHVLQVARISPENRFVVLMLDKLGLVETSTLVHLGILTALDASVSLVEGLGLWFGAAWAEYLVVVSSGIFLPEESLALLRHYTWVRLSILVINAIIFIYVANLVWNRHKHRRSGASPTPA